MKKHYFSYIEGMSYSLAAEERDRLRDKNTLSRSQKARLSELEASTRETEAYLDANPQIYRENKAWLKREAVKEQILNELIDGRLRSTAENVKGNRSESSRRPATANVRARSKH